MSQQSLFTVNEETKNTLLEISALSGYAQNVCKEILEYQLINWAVKLADNPDNFADLNIPFLGSVKVRYAKDRILPSGELDTEVDSYVELNPAFRKLVGDIHDEGYTEIVPMLEKKIKNAIMVASVEE